MWSLQKGLKATFKNICMSECVSVCGGELWGGGFSGFFFSFAGLQGSRNYPK